MTTAELQAELTTYTTARDAILTGGQAYDVNGRSVSRANLEFIEKKIAELRFALQRASGPTHAQAVFRGRS